MKRLKMYLSLVAVVAILFASTVSSGAIGFEAETAYESVFVIYCGNSLGSGFAVGENCIVTNAHVVDSGSAITVQTYGGEQYRATVLGSSAYMDIAVLIVEGANFPFLEIADLSTMKTGDDIYTIGAPKGMTYTLTKGGISAKERELNGQTYIQIDAPINEGNSGGPLLNDQGQVLGMNTLKLLEAEGIGLAIPVSRICQYLRSLGVELDAGGNVPDSIPLPGKPNPGNPNSGETPDYENETTDRQKKDTPVITFVAIGVAAVSIIGNIILAILLINEKKKTASLLYDPSERTDFEIEILE